MSTHIQKGMHAVEAFVKACVQLRESGLDPQQVLNDIEEMRQKALRGELSAQETAAMDQGRAAGKQYRQELAKENDA